MRLDTGFIEEVHEALLGRLFERHFEGLGGLTVARDEVILGAALLLDKLNHAEPIDKTTQGVLVSNHLLSVLCLTFKSYETKVHEITGIMRNLDIENCVEPLKEVR